MEKLIVAILTAVVLFFAELAAAAEPLPELPPETADSKLSMLSRIYVRKFTFDGNTVFSNKTLSALVAEFENRNITAEELHDVRRNISTFYLSNGYVNSGAVLPDHGLGRVRFDKGNEGSCIRLERSGVDNHA